MSATTPHDDPYLVVEQSPKFRDLRSRYRRFIFPMGALFMAWYLLLIYCAGWQREWMGTKVFGAITVGDVVSAVEAAGGPSVDKRKVTIVSPIKTVGAHKVQVRVHPEVLADLTVDVVSA